LSQKGEEGILIGYKSINYQIYILEIDKIKIARDITILENKKYNEFSNIESLKPLLEVKDNEEEDNTAISSKTSDLTIEIPKNSINEDEYKEYHSSTTKEEEEQENTTLRRSTRSK
jgi:hypothetical protein